MKKNTAVTPTEGRSVMKLQVSLTFTVVAGLSQGLTVGQHGHFRHSHTHHRALLTGLVLYRTETEIISSNVFFQSCIFYILVLFRVTSGAGVNPRGHLVRAGHALQHSHSHSHLHILHVCGNRATVEKTLTHTSENMRTPHRNIII